MIFRPSAQVRLQIRLEEFASTSLLEARVQAEGRGSPASQTRAPRQEQRRLEEERAMLQGVRRLFPDGSSEREEADAQLTQNRDDLRRVRQQQRVQTPGRAPAAVDGEPPDDRVILGSIQPEYVEIERRGLNETDRCTIHLNYADAPFDSQIVRSASVEVVIGEVTPEEFEYGIAGARRRRDGTLTSIIGRQERGGVFGIGSSFVGWVDDWGSGFSGDDGDTLELACSDMSALLHHTNLSAGDSIDLMLPLDEGIRRLLELYPTTRGLEVVNGYPTENNPDPLPAASVGSSSRPRRGRRARRARRSDEQVTLWQHIQDVCGSVAITPKFFGYRLHLIRARTFFGRGRVRKMVWGGNLRTLSLSRKLSGVKVPTIEVRAYDPGLGRVRWARYPVRPGERTSGIIGQQAPPRPLRANEVSPSGDVVEERVETIRVSGITDPEQLEEIAHNAFHSMGRGELKGTFETHDSASWQAEQPGDLYTLGTGEPVELLATAPASDRPGTRATSAEVLSMTRAQRSRYLHSRGWAQDVADRFAAIQDDLGFQTIFRTHTIKLSLTADEGLKVIVDFINFIEVRELGSSTDQDQAQGPGAEVSADEQAQATARRRLALNTMRRSGIISEERYQERMGELLDEERTLVRAGDG